ncbi:MAG: hypothetical protein ABFS32_02345 [Bacteroidota bacterium]
MRILLGTILVYLFVSCSDNKQDASSNDNIVSTDINDTTSVITPIVSISMDTLSFNTSDSENYHEIKIVELDSLTIHFTLKVVDQIDNTIHDIQGKASVIPSSMDNMTTIIDDKDFAYPSKEYLFQDLDCIVSISIESESKSFLSFDWDGKCAPNGIKTSSTQKLKRVR